MLDMASQPYQTPTNVMGFRIGVSLISGLLLSVAYSFIELQTAYFHRSPDCGNSAFISALLPTNETAPLVFWLNLAVRFIALSVTVYVFQPFSGGERNFGQTVWRSLFQGAAVFLVVAILYFGGMPTRICVSQYGFSYRVAGVTQDYKWNDVAAVESQCLSHGIKKISLKISDGSKIILPPSFLFAARQKKLVSIVESLNIEFVGLSRPLSYSSLCSYHD